MARFTWYLIFLSKILSLFQLGRRADKLYQDFIFSFFLYNSNSNLTRFATDAFIESDCDLMLKLRMDFITVSPFLLSSVMLLLKLEPRFSAASFMRCSIFSRRRERGLLGLFGNTVNTSTTSARSLISSSSLPSFSISIVLAFTISRSIMHGVVRMMAMIAADIISNKLSLPNKLSTSELMFVLVTVLSAIPMPKRVASQNAKVKMPH
mmetsp:Transcript_6478/g.8777  ORF Transcript_6478/g.8777 Transcript_6478/m.8777 type:complete len:208 (+) Transcript_6478:1069-1692(+)